MATTWELLSRERKAAGLVEALRKAQVASDELRGWMADEVGWKTLAELTGTKIASPATRAIVLEQLERAEQAWEGVETL